MANLHVTQIKNKLKEYFSDCVDVSDVSERAEDYKENIFVLGAYPHMQFQWLQEPIIILPLKL
ncbi:hypothetical protein D3C84_1070770 [compost metagenome]